MAGKVQKSFGYGFAGQVSRGVDFIAEALPNTGDTAIAFGGAVVIDGEGVRAFKEGDTPPMVVGFATRYTKSNDTYGVDDAQINPGEMVSLIKRGSITVKLDGGTPKKGAVVYLTSSGNVSALADGNTALANVKFATGADESGIAEIVILTRAL